MENKGIRIIKCPKCACENIHLGNVISNCDTKEGVTGVENYVGRTKVIRVELFCEECNSVTSELVLHEHKGSTTLFGHEILPKMISLDKCLVEEE